MEIEKLKDMLRNAAGSPVGIQVKWADYTAFVKEDD